MLSQSTQLLSVVLPCYNPANTVYGDIVSHFTALKKIHPYLQLIIVNDGSAKNFDESHAKQFFALYPEITLVSYRQNRGKGYALREGIKIASGEYIIYTDIDFPYTSQSFFKVLEALSSKQCDIAVGIRPGSYYLHLPKSRVHISKLLRFLIRRLLDIPTDDTQCGLKGFNTAGKKVFLQTAIDRYLFDLEFVFLATRKKLSIKTVEAVLRPEIILSPMRLNILIQESVNFLKIFAKSFF